MDITEIKKRVMQAENEKQKNRTKFSDVAKVVDPDRDQYFNQDWNYTTRFRDVYDSTAVLAARTFINTMQQSIVPTQQEWAELAFSEGVPEQIRQSTIQIGGQSLTLEQALSISSKIVFSYINASNFDAAINESLRDVVISTGVISADYNISADALEFRSHSLCDILLDPSPYSKPKSIYSSYKMPVHCIRDLWPEADISALKAKMKDSTMLCELTAGVIYDYDEQLHYTFLLSKDTDSLLFLEKYGEFSPYVVFRTDVSPSETYGRGIGQMVAPTARTLQEVQKDLLTASQITMFGMYMSNDDSVIGDNQIEFTAGTILPVKSTSSTNPSIVPLPTSGNINLSDLSIQDMRQMINKAFMVNPIGDMNDPTKTATEIIARQQMAMADRIPEAMRLANEMGKGVFKLVVEILQANNKIPKFIVDGKTIKINLKSPIATLTNQQTAQQSMRALQELQQAGIPLPLIQGSIKLEEMPDYVWTNFDCDPMLKRTDQEKQQLQQGIEQQQALAQQQQQQQQQQGQPQQGQPQQ